MASSVIAALCAGFAADCSSRPQTRDASPDAMDAAIDVSPSRDSTGDIQSELRVEASLPDRVVTPMDVFVGDASMALNPCVTASDCEALARPLSILHTYGVSAWACIDSVCTWVFVSSTEYPPAGSTCTSVDAGGALFGSCPECTDRDGGPIPAEPSCPRCAIQPPLWASWQGSTCTGYSGFEPSTCNGYFQGTLPRCYLAAVSGTFCLAVLSCGNCQTLLDFHGDGICGP